jgi:hypothetical protein
MQIHNVVYGRCQILERRILKDKVNAKTRALNVCWLGRWKYLIVYFSGSLFISNTALGWVGSFYD